ncbi:MAG TPA: four helix bundle protein [Candidatus Cloacimonadota bacterium]|nr:four helix bundle protein [Candidatus Cloacimonadota bacterium]
MKESILKSKSYEFAKAIVHACYKLNNQREFILSKQLLRSGTSIGAMIRESEFGQSKADFVSKLSIALKEANETEYWLSLLHDTNLIKDELYNSLSPMCRELIRLLAASVKTLNSSKSENC